MVDEIKPYTPEVVTEDQLAADRQEELAAMLEEGVFPQEQVGPLVAQVSASLDGLREQVALLTQQELEYRATIEQLQASMQLREFFYYAKQPFPVETVETLDLNAPTVVEMTVPVSVPGDYKLTMAYNWNSSLSTVYCISWLEVEQLIEGGIHRQKSQLDGGADEEYLIQRPYYLTLGEGSVNVRYRMMTGYEASSDPQPGDIIEAAIKNATMELVKVGTG